MNKTNKIVLCISFSIALIPVFFQWFDIGNGAEMRTLGWRGIGIMRLEFFASIIAYYVALFLEKRWAMICSQALVITSYLIALSHFTRRTNISYVQNWEMTMSGLQWTFGLAIITIVANALLTLILAKKQQ